MTEQWLPVIGYGGYYEISDHGNVRSVTRVVEAGTSRQRTLKGKPLKVKKLPKSDHVRVALMRNGIRKERLVHHLVLEAFVDLQPEGKEGCHKDDVGNNNVVSNLYWGTRVQNSREAVRNGRNVNANKVKCPQGHKYDRVVKRSGTDQIYRSCAECARNATRKYYRNLRSA